MIGSKTISFWWIPITALLVIVVFQLLNPIRADAPSNHGNKLSLSSPLPLANFQDISSGRVRAAVLMYHHIGPLPDGADQLRTSLTVSAEEFASQLEYLKNNNFSVLTLGQLERAIAQKKVPLKPVVITFDDGYEDNYNYALPILQKYGFSATFFIISNRIGQPGYMSREQIEEIASSNEIGSHSYSHPSMVRLSDYHLERELKTSKEDLEAIISKPVTSFCYPAGKYDDKVVKKLQEYGYKIAVTTEASTGSFSTDSLFLLPRYRMAPAINLETLIR